MDDIDAEYNKEMWLFLRYLAKCLKSSKAARIQINFLGLDHKIVDAQKRMIQHLEIMNVVKDVSPFITAYHLRMAWNEQSAHYFEVHIDKKEFQRVYKEYELAVNKCPLTLDRDGSVKFNGKKIGDLKVGTLPYHYLNFLIEHYPNPIAYGEVQRELKDAGLTNDSKPANNFCADLKRHIKDINPKIASFINHSKGTAVLKALET